MMFKNTFYLAKNTVSKSLIISKVHLENILQFLLPYSIFDLKATFLLVPLQDYCPAKKQNSKKNLI